MRPQPMIVLSDVAAAVILEGPLVNPNAGQREVWLRGPGSYLVVVAGPRDAPR